MVFVSVQDEYPFLLKLCLVSFSLEGRRIDWLIVFLPKHVSIAKDLFASCTTSLSYVNLFKELFLFVLFAWSNVRSRKRMQRYGFFRNLQNFYRKNRDFIPDFNIRLQFSRQIVGAHIYNIHARALVFDVGKIDEQGRE